MFTVQTLIALAVVVGLAVILTTAIMIAGNIWQRSEARAAFRHLPVVAQTDDAREPALH